MSDCFICWKKGLHLRKLPALYAFFTFLWKNKQDWNVRLCISNVTCKNACQEQEQSSCRMRKSVHEIQSGHRWCWGTKRRFYRMKIDIDFLNTKKVETQTSRVQWKSKMGGAEINIIRLKTMNWSLRKTDFSDLCQFYFAKLRRC